MLVIIDNISHQETPSWEYESYIISTTASAKWQWHCGTRAGNTVDITANSECSVRACDAMRA